MTPLFDDGAGEAMNGNDSEVRDRHVPNSSNTAHKPWYRRKWIGVAGVLLILAVSAYQYIQYRIQYLFYRPIEVTRGPWQVLDPGKPVEPLEFEVMEKGKGPVVEPGDLVQLSLQWWSAQRRENDHTTVWWVWVGFRTVEETPFYAMNPQLLSTLVGQREGGGLRFTESPSYIAEGGGMRQRERPGTSAAGEVYINPFGSFNYYARKKSGYEKMSMRVFIPTRSGHMDVYITKVFKGQLKYRMTHLYDDTWVHRCYNFLSCEYTNAPREGWVDEARYDGESADSQRATFQYGPVGTPGLVWTGPTTHYSAGDWSDREWEKLPLGVQVGRSAKDGDVWE
jgi:hypothetical protein